jgi:pyruvate dehydrogenase E2 component (dihydrolipoamide acetyltransferase)
MEAGILVEWRVRAGDRVKRGDIIAEVETDKGLIEIEVFEDGVVDQLLIEPGKKLPVGTVLATILGEGAQPAAPLTPTVPPGTIERARISEMPRGEIAAPPGPRRVRASPLARKLAEELGVDISTLQGTGPGGAIDREDVERAAAERKAAPVAGGVPELPIRMRRAIAAAMARSNREIPHYYLETRIDMSRPLRWLDSENQKRSIRERILPAVLLIKGVARALADVPELNGYWKDDELQKMEAVHAGFAISIRRGGLIVPAIHDVNRRSLDEIMAALHDLIPRARSGRLRSSEMVDGTITITNLGELGVEGVYGVIYPPQVALVGFGRISEQPWAENGMLGVRPVLRATLAADHRATDGNQGAQFLDSLNRHLQEADKL